MPEIITKLQRQFVDFWQNLDKSQRTRIFIISGVLVAAITIGIVIMTRTSYVPLLSISDGQDAKEITKVLDDGGINYKPGSNGQILVDAKDKNKAEFSLASSGLMSASGMAFEDAWNLLKINSTESDKSHLWQQYKKSTLIAKLKMFDNVKDADVDLTMPEKSPFIKEGDSDNATAYVRISPKGDISEEQVQGIVQVVASSIEGLDPKNVTVVDNNFNILSSETGDSSIGRTGSQYKMRLKVKEEIEKSVKALYPGRSDSFDYIVPIANPVLDFNKKNSTTQDVQLPTGMDDGAVISSQKTQENLENGTQGGVPGTDTNPGNGNVPSYPTTGSGNSNYNKKTETLNKKYKEVLTEEEKALGEMNFENSSMTVTLWYGQRVLDDTKITPQFLDQFKNDVSSATGIPAGKISVNKYKLAAPVEEKVPFTDTLKSYFDQYGYFVLLLLLIIGLLIAVKPRKVKEQPLLAGGDLVMAGMPGGTLDPEEELAEIEFDDSSEVKKQLEKFVKERPEAVAQLLRNWLQEDWE